MNFISIAEISLYLIDLLKQVHKQKIDTVMGC